MMTHKHSVSRDSWSFLWKCTILAIALLVNVTLGVRLFWGPQSFSNFYRLKAQQTALQAELDAKDSINATLSREIRLLQTDERYVEKMIRQRLNYVKEQETLYLFDHTRQDANTTGAARNARKN